MKNVRYLPFLATCMDNYEFSLVDGVVVSVPMQLMKEMIFKKLNELNRYGHFDLVYPEELFDDILGTHIFYTDTIVYGIEITMGEDQCKMFDAFSEKIALHAGLSVLYDEYDYNHIVAITGFTIASIGPIINGIAISDGGNIKSSNIDYKNPSWINIVG